MSEPIRIAQVLNRMDSGGIEAVLMNYYRYIDRNKIQFDFYFREGSACPQREELERLGAGIYTLPPYTKLLTYQRALTRIFKEKKYRVVHSHLSTMSLFPLLAARRAGVPVRICHNHSTANWGEGMKTLLKYLLRPLNKLVATHWFACGIVAGRWMYGKRAFDGGKVHLMPNSIDEGRFAYDPQARAAIREELGIAENAFVVGHVGRFTYAKNHGFLIDVFERLHKIKPDACLMLTGEGENEQKIRSLVELKGLGNNVIFTGVRSDVNKLYSAMDVFCLPSNYEGFTLVAVEAQISGLDCIRSDNVSGEVDFCGNISHLPIDNTSIDRWVERIMQAKPTDRRETVRLPEQLHIESTARKYQEFLGGCYEEAISKS